MIQFLRKLNVQLFTKIGPSTILLVYAYSLRARGNLNGQVVQPHKLFSISEAMDPTILTNFRWTSVFFQGLTLLCSVALIFLSIFAFSSDDYRLPPELRKRHDVPATFLTFGLLIFSVSILSATAVITGSKFGLQTSLGLSVLLLIAQIILLVVFGRQKQDWDEDLYNGTLTSGIVLSTLQVVDVALLWVIGTNMPSSEMEEERLLHEHERLLSQEREQARYGSAA